MLHEITVRNFKLFDETGITINPGRITVFIGPNGTGKSSVLQALSLIKQGVVKGAFKLDGPAVFAEYPDLMHHGPLTADSYIEVTGSVDPYPPFMPAGGAFSYGFSFDSLGLIDQRFIMKADGDLVISGEVMRDQRVVGTSPPSFSIAGGLSVLMRASMSFGRPMEFGVRHVQGTPSLIRETQRKAEQWADSIPRCLRSVYVVPALRGFERLAYQQLENPVDLVRQGGARPSRGLGALGKRGVAAGGVGGPLRLEPISFTRAESLGRGDPAAS